MSERKLDFFLYAAIFQQPARSYDINMVIYTPFFSSKYGNFEPFFSQKEICWIQSLPISLPPSDEISPSKKKTLINLNMRARRGFFFQFLRT
jgi:hypothetical protein